MRQIERWREGERDLVTNVSPVLSRLGFSSQCVMGRDVHFRIILQHSKMECLAESMSVDPSKHRQELLERLDILRNNNSFCDVTIAVKDKEFKAHRAVLAAASPFFLTLLTSNMKESNEQLIKVELKEATETVMEDALKYLYTGNVTVVEERAHNLIATANYLLLPSLKTMAGNVLKETVSIENCLFNYYFADKYEEVELKEKCREVINSNFSVVMETDDFLNLDVKQVMEWVSSDDIVVNAEEDIFQGIVKWVSHDKSEREKDFPELLLQIRLSSISHDFLLNTLVKEELITENPVFCLNFVVNAMKSSLLSSSDRESSQLPRKCQETHTDGIFICGGRKALCYFPQENMWYGMAGTLFEHENPTPAWYKNKVYIFDSKIHKVGESQVMERYEQEDNTWEAFQRAFQTNFKSYLVLNNELHAVFFPSYPQFEKLGIHRYDSETNKWNKMESSPFAQQYSCVVNDHVQYMYIVAGKNTNRTSRYDSRDNKWEELACCNEVRYNAFGAAMNGKIYIAGGETDHGYLSSCEVYNPASDEWQLISSLKERRFNASMLCFHGRLYVLGGTIVPPDCTSTVQALTVEMFNSERNEWTEISKIPVERFESQEEMKKKKVFKAFFARLRKKVIHKLKPLN